MEPLLYLAHRMPYPPNKGDKIRSFNILRYLSARYRVMLGAFVDDPADLEHRASLSSMCEATRLVPLSKTWARVKALASLPSSRPLTISYLRSDELQAWVTSVVMQHGIRKAFVFSSGMTSYVKGMALETVADYCDVDSEKWAEYGRVRSWPASAVFKREGALLLAHERAAARSVAAVTFATTAEADLFNRLAPECRSVTHVLRNGIDTEFFCPSPAIASPFTVGEIPLVFSGAMDYWPNVDAVVWFAREVLPQVLRTAPTARFYVVGMNPSPKVKQLANDNVVVTGRVPDVRPYVNHAAVVVAPLRLARGIQNKVLEAMAMARPVVATPQACEGLDATPREHLIVAADAARFAAEVLDLLAGTTAHDVGLRAREYVRREMRWDSALRPLDSLWKSPSADAAA